VIEEQVICGPGLHCLNIHSLGSGEKEVEKKGRGRERERVMGWAHRVEALHSTLYSLCVKSTPSVVEFAS
jgi:hypothetical protein